MSDFTELFLAGECSGFSDLHPGEVPAGNRLEFDPGLMALELLCAAVTGLPSTDDLVRSSAHLVYLDGPPDPEMDEGFQLYRVVEGAARQLAGLPADRAEATATAWLREFARYPFLKHELPALTALVNQVADLARRGQSAGQSLYVRVLYR